MKRDSDDSPRTSKNTSEKVREYTIRELEERAHSILAAAFPLGVRIPVEIEDVAFHLGLDINPIPGLQEACQVLGTIWRDCQGKYWVVVDEHLMDHLEARYRFTVAEEVSHYILHKEHIDAAKNVGGAIRLQEKLKENYRYVEANTRRLAACLLMPGAPLRGDAGSAYREVIGVVGYRNLEAVKRQVTDILRRKYVVSSKAMEYRLRHHPLRVYEALNDAFRAQSNALWESS